VVRVCPVGIGEKCRCFGQLSILSTFCAVDTCQLDDRGGLLCIGKDCRFTCRIVRVSPYLVLVVASLHYQMLVGYHPYSTSSEYQLGFGGGLLMWRHMELQRDYQVVVTFSIHPDYSRCHVSSVLGITKNPYMS
jgi:hypothetical protein